MKINLEILHSCTIKRKKPWPKVSWLGLVSLINRPNLGINNIISKSLIFNLKKVKRAVIYSGLSANVIDRSADRQDQTPSRPA